MNILLVDNYDSFTHNLFHLIKAAGNGSDRIDIVHNDRITAEAAAAYDRIVLSPGPGIPSEAGNMPGIIRAAAGRVPVLGICLGHQAIAETFGAGLYQVDHPFHGVKSPIYLADREQVFRGLPPVIEAGRYHSWLVREEGLPACLKVTARDGDGNIMAVSHRRFDMHGIQFHPESCMTEYGCRIMCNFLYRCGRR